MPRFTAIEALSFVHFEFREILLYEIPGCLHVPVKLENWLIHVSDFAHNGKEMNGNNNNTKKGREGACKAFVFVHYICKIGAFVFVHYICKICGVVATHASRILNCLVSQVQLQLERTCVN